MFCSRRCSSYPPSLLGRDASPNSPNPLDSRGVSLLAPCYNTYNAALLLLLSTILYCIANELTEAIKRVLRTETEVSRVSMRSEAYLFVLSTDYKGQFQRHARN